MMDPIRNITVPKAPQALPVLGGSADTGSVLPKPAASGPQPEPSAAQIQAVAEQRRIEAVIRAAQDIANIYIVSDRRFTIFKDATGQYITRFTNLRDGKVTYIPEPELLRMQQSAAAPALSLNV